eukprot:scaffold5792_cov54-Phaeocystis_antarctica.AAC.1
MGAARRHAESGGLLAAPQLGSPAPPLTDPPGVGRSAMLGLDYDCQFAKPVATRAGCKDVAILLDPQAAQAGGALAREARSIGTFLTPRLQAAPFGVQSAFNGLALYQVGALARHNATGCRFEGSRMSRICEHVPFSLCLGRHGLRLGVRSQNEP